MKYFQYGVYANLCRTITPDINFNDLLSYVMMALAMQFNIYALFFFGHSFNQQDSLFDNQFSHVSFNNSYKTRHGEKRTCRFVSKPAIQRKKLWNLILGVNLPNLGT